ncbi:hypothetical protein V1264_021104 [Littorina saxatilis]|uniref:G-protein coupled receptors family 3 profile domain-containing protein n=1 Tax=Littorina saxatilis TaxID=31220 RepID=A0AAN9BE00_9CAEN
MTSPELTSAVTAILKPMEVHHVDISSGDVENDVNQKGRQRIALQSQDRAKATQTLLEELNISYVTPKSVNEETVAQREATHFHELALQSPQLCSVPSPTLDNLPTPVLFIGENDSRLEVEVIAGGDSNVVVVVGDNFAGFANDTTNTVLWLRESVNESEIEDMLLMNLTEGPSGIPRPLNVSLCTSFHVDNDVNTTSSSSTSSSENPCILKRHTLRKLQALSDAFAYVASETFDNSNDTNATDFEMADEEYETPLDQFLYSGRKQVVQRKMQYGVIVFENGSVVAENASDITTDVIDRVIIPQFLRDRGLSRQCDVNCHLCDVCAPKMTSEQKIMTSSPLEESSLVIVGLFPISESRDGRECGLENTDGREAAHWFLNAVASYNDIHTSVLPNVTVGAVVLDTCGQEHKSLTFPNDIESCLASYTDFYGDEVTIQPSRVVAYVDYKNYVQHGQLSKAVMTLTDDEYHLFTDSHIEHVQQMGDILKTISWSYIKLVIPEGYARQADVRQILTNKGVCIAEEVVVGKNNLVEAAAKLLSDSSAVLFLTDHSTTHDLMADVYHQSPDNKLKYAFMPWNSANFYDTDLPKNIEIAITTEHVVDEGFQYPRSRDIPDPWQGALEPVSTERSSRLAGLSLTSLAVQHLMNSLGAAYKTLCPEGRGVCRAMEDVGVVKGVMMEQKERRQEMGRGSGVSSLASHHQMDVFALHNDRKVKIGRVDYRSQVQMDEAFIIQNTIVTSECPGWCPQCYTCSSSTSPTTSSTPHTNTAMKFSPASRNTEASRSETVVSGHHPFKPVISIPGDILIAGMFPVHKPGKESFTCGELVNSEEERRAEQAFLFAVETAKKRYANLLPGVEVGGILLDSCSNLATSLHMLGQFESCEMGGELSLGGENGSQIQPVQVVGYVLQDDFNTASVLRDTVRGLDKMASVSSLHGMNDGVTSLESPQRLAVDAMLDLFSEFQWSHAHILTSEAEKYMDMAEYFVDEAGYRGVCVSTYQQMIPGGRNVRRVAEILSDPASAFVPVILFLSRADAVTLFRDREVSGLTRPWVVSMIGDDWLSTVGINIPWGALLVDVQGKVNDDFQVFLEQFSTFTETPLPPWWRQYLQVRAGCQTSSYADSPLSAVPLEELCQENPLLTGPMYPSAPASRVIRSVDSVLHALDTRYKNRCTETNGICRELSKDIVGGKLNLADASFMYEEGLVSFERDGDMEVTLSIMSYQPGQLVMAGTYRSTGLSVNTSLVQFFSSRGDLLPQPRPFPRCATCTCINVVTNMTRSPAPSTTPPPALAEWLWREERGVFIREMWAWIVLAVAIGGAVTTMIFIIYVMFKVWQGALARRYIGLGLLLLAAITLLYLSVLPFLFTPSPSVCGLRYLFPAMALCLCFACVLVKLMALQDYRTIGLGGELCGVNQAMVVFFVLLVQISISVQWWIFNSPFLEETVDLSNDVIKVSCHFRPRDFALNLCFVVFLVVLSSLYSLTVRREKKNMGEARLLLAGSWAVLVLWAGWIPVFLSLEDRYSSVAACGGVLGTACALLFVVYVPKVRMVARLKYDLSKKTGLRNGYSVDTDFLYERPYSLPGTLTSTYSSIRTYPKSVAATNFDSSFSY